MITIGIVGAGRIAERHLDAYRRLPDVQVVLTDIVPAGEQLARRFDVKWQANPDTLIAANDVDAIDVCVPTSAHAQVILKALEHRKHVFTEKPLARNLEEAQHIQRQAQKAGTLLMVGYLYRFHPAIAFAREVLRQGVIGEPYYALFRLGGRGSNRAWKHRRETGGGAANEMMVHMLDLILWYFGDVATVENLYTDTLLREREIDGERVEADAEDVILWKLTTAGGVTAVCESDLLTPSYMNSVEVQGTNGSLWTTILDYFPTVLFCKEPRGGHAQGQSLFHFPRADLFERELAHFVSAIKNGGPSLNSLEDSLKILGVMEQALGGVRGKA